MRPGTGPDADADADADAVVVAARGIAPGRARGPALVSDAPVSFLGDIDIASGRVVNDDSPIAGRSVAGTVLVVTDTIGSAGAWRFLYQLFVHRTHPVAIVSVALPDSSLVQGAILARIPVLCAPQVDAVTAFADGEPLEVDGAAGTVRRDGTRSGGAP